MCIRDRSSMCSSYGFVYLLEPTFSVKQPRHKQLFSDVVHLNQRGLAILLRRIISFLPCSQRQLPHTKLTRQQRPGGDNVKSACDAAVRKLESASRRTQDPHKDSHKDGHQSHQPHYRVDTNRTKSSTGTAAIHRRHSGGPSLPDGGAVVTRGSHDGSRLEPPYSGPPPAQWPPLLEARRHMSHRPVAAHRTDGHGALLAACPCEPGRTSRTGARSCAIMAFILTVLTP